VGGGDLSASFVGAGSVACRSAKAIGLTAAFASLRGFCGDGFSAGFFFASTFGADGSAASFGTDAVRVAFGFGVTGGGGELFAAGAGEAPAIGALSGLTVCEAADRGAVFGASTRCGVESVEAGRGGGVAIGGPSGLIACEADGEAAVFGASVRDGVESSEAGAGGAVAIGAPSGVIACEADGAAVFGASARGGAGSGEAGGDGAVAIGAPSGPILCEVTSVAEPAELKGSGACSFCGLTRLSVAATAGSLSRGFEALLIRA
jgi:hypothetical protein